jgi:hypothetical protein
MEHWIEMAITIICAVFASSGFWAFMQKRSEKKDAKFQMILGLGHDRIKYLCEQHIKNGWISTGDYEDLYKYLYVPYKAMGGNGTVEKLMEEIKKLPSFKNEEVEANE